MSKSKKDHVPASKAEEDAWAIAKGTQREGQTKEQTKLIAQGIKKGIDLYKKQQSAKQREMDKQRKKGEKEKSQKTISQPVSKVIYKQHWLPWMLLVVSWVSIAIYFSLVTSA